MGQTNYQIVLALSYIVILTGKSFDITTALIASLDKSVAKDWSSCMDRRQVWNQKRPPWYEAILHMVFPVLDPIVHMLVVAVQTGATMYQVWRSTNSAFSRLFFYQAMALAISCLSEMWDCIPDCLYNVASALTEILSTDIKPLGKRLYYMKFLTKSNIKFN